MIDTPDDDAVAGPEWVNAVVKNQFNPDFRHLHGALYYATEGSGSQE
jgi:hypothetical protein